MPASAKGTRIGVSGDPKTFRSKGERRAHLSKYSSVVDEGAAKEVKSAFSY